MQESIITYETLYEILRAEKFRQELQKLDPEFSKNIISYLKEKRAILKSQQSKSSIFSSTESKKTQKQVENFEQMLKELYERRENKILQLALFSSRTKEDIDPSIMLPEEFALFNKIKENLGLFRGNILSNLLTEKLPEIQKNNQKQEPKDIKTTQQSKKTKLIRLTKAIPKFLGNDLNIYGPYEKEDVANLPEETASLLIEKKRAKPL